MSLAMSQEPSDPSGCRASSAMPRHVNLSADLQATPCAHSGLCWGLSRRLSLAVSQRSSTSYAPSPFAWWKPDPRNLRGPGNRAQGSLCSPGHSPADLGFGGSRLLKKVGPRFFDLGSHRREKFTVLFCVVTWDQRWVVGWRDGLVIKMLLAQAWEPECIYLPAPT